MQKWITKSLRSRGINTKYQQGSAADANIDTSGAAQEGEDSEKEDEDDCEDDEENTDDGVRFQATTGSISLVNGELITDERDMLCGDVDYNDVGEDGFNLFDTVDEEDNDEDPE